MDTFPLRRAGAAAVGFAVLITALLATGDSPAPVARPTNFADGSSPNPFFASGSLPQGELDEPAAIAYRPPRAGPGTTARARSTRSVAIPANGRAAAVPPPLPGHAPTTATTARPGPPAAGQLAFLDTYGGRLHLGSAAGDPARSIPLDKVWEMTWSRDGRRVAVLVDDLPWKGDLDPSHTYGIYAIDSDDGDIHEVGRSLPGLAIGGLAWSPDGTRLVVAQGVASYYGCELGLYVFRVSDGSSRRITAGGCDVTPDWSPDGTAIAFTRLAGLTMAVWRVAPDGTGPRQLSPVITNAFDPTDALAWAGGPRWSPDSGAIVFERDFGVWTVKADGASASMLAPRPDNEWHAFPEWSPDGSHIAFEALIMGRSSSRQELRVIGRDGKGARVIGNGPWASPPSWSPDGAWVAAALLSEDRCGEIVLHAARPAAKPDGNGADRRSTGYVGCSPMFSPV